MPREKKVGVECQAIQMIVEERGEELNNITRIYTRDIHRERSLTTL